MTDENQVQNFASLPMRALEDIPQANANAHHITALVKEKGRVTGYQLDNGEVLTKPQAVALAKQGDIAGVGIAQRKGSEYLKSLPDGREENNLSSLPTATL